MKHHILKWPCIEVYVHGNIVLSGHIGCGLSTKYLKATPQFKGPDLNNRCYGEPSKYLNTNFQIF